MYKPLWFTAFMLIVVLFAPLKIQADTLKLGRYFSDDLVLQRDQPSTIHGMAKPGEKITLTFAGQRHESTANQDGFWTCALDPIPANKQGQTLTAKTADGASVTIENVVVGDVFLLAFQTTLDRQVGDIPKQAALPETLRRIVIETIPAAKPLNDLVAEATTGWSKFTPQSAAVMRPAAYQFAIDLAKAIPDVPIGVIDLNMNGAFPIGWLSRASIADSEKLTGNGEPERVAQRLDNLATLERTGQPFPPKEVIGSDPLNYPLFPAGGYNAVLNPLQGVALSGVVLQLGNNYPYEKYKLLKKQGTHLQHDKLNRAYVEVYDVRKTGFRMDSPTAPRVPGELRKVFNNPELPIGWVLVPGAGVTTLADRNIEFRELQHQIAQREDHTDLIVPNMETIMFSAQPSDASTLGQRAAVWAASIVNSQAHPIGTGPVFDHVDIQNNKAMIHFKPGTATGLKARTPEALSLFEVAGVEGEYLPAKATIEGDTIRLQTNQINRISRLRYNWQRKPDLNLVNAAGLPAAPFRVEDKTYQWFFRHEEDNLPAEYSTPANQWTGGDVTLINGQTKTFGYTDFAGWLGPVGVRVGPFGPNMAVRDVLIGSPAEGKLKVGDVIYSANGQMLGDDAQKVMSAAITESETEDKQGKLTLGLRRGNQNMDVVIDLKVMGSYSPTAPYNCVKTDRIIADLEQWVADRGGVGENNFLSTDTLFLLAADNPQYQGLVRRYVYNKLLNFEKGTVNWYLGYDAMLLAEYYLATGDRNVLPVLQRYVDNLIAHQIEPEDAGPLPGRIGGWYGRNKAYRAYPTMPSAGLVCAIALVLAKEAGVDVDQDAYDKAIQHFVGKGASVGQVIYGNAWRDVPKPLDPEKMLAGKISSDNGKISIAGVLFDLHGDQTTAHYCSLISTFAFNHTYDGHGGNFWNNFWTPIGAYVQGQPAFEHFMDGHRWYRELNRMFDGSMITSEVDRVGAGHGIALTIPKNRLRITGSAKSPFSVNAPAMLQPALYAYEQKDYAKAEKRVDDLLKTGTVPKADLATVQKLGHEARQIQLSIDADFEQINKLIQEGRFHEAKLDIRQLKAVTPPDDPRLAEVEKALAEGKPRPDDVALYQKQQQAFTAVTQHKVKPKASDKPAWTTVVTEAASEGKEGKIQGMVAADQASVWRMMVVENRDQAPENWTQPDFDDADWDQTTLPISWTLNHTVLLRTTFKLDELDDIEGMRFRAWLFRQQDIAIYLNGQLVGRINNLEKKSSNVDGSFKPWAVSQLKQGENTLAVVTRQNWRWGMLFMRVYNNGFGFMLDVGRTPEPHAGQAKAE